MKKQFKPHEDYEFVNHDKVFCYVEDGSAEYFELYYEQEMAAWMLVPFTDKAYTEVKTNEEGKTEGEFLYEYGYDLLERVEDYDFEELP